MPGVLPSQQERGGLISAGGKALHTEQAGGFVSQGQGQGREAWAAEFCCKTKKWAQPEPRTLGQVLSAHFYIGLGK